MIRPAAARILAVVGVCALLAACGGAAEAPASQYTYEVAGETMGTTYTVRVDSESRPFLDGELGARVQEVLDRINARMSTYVDESEVSVLNAAEPDATVTLSDDTYFVLQSAVFLSESSSGAFDPTVGALVNAWGFGPVNASTAPSAYELETLAAHTGIDKLEMDNDALSVRKLDPQTRVDLSAIAKGYAADKVGDFLEESGLTRYMVEVGGEVLVGEPKRDGTAWNIGIETPDVGAAHLQRLVALRDRAMATSGNYRNFYVMDGRTVGHTIDPRDGQPVDHNGASVSVIHESCMMADGMATVLMVMGPDEGFAWAEANDVAAMFVVHDGEGFVERLTTAFTEITSVQTQMDGGGA
ncbi:MAG: FAD:protein FMN transferase ApbE [Acidobacteria bacterium]|nr:FAD:protein FMN transferase ApbE [Acidobacteriota bacterium]